MDQSDNKTQEQQQQQQQSSNFVHQMEHPGVQCDVCETQIRGFRYKCMTCPNYDLCAPCERRGLHAGHPMMRIAFPEQAAEATLGFCGRKQRQQQQQQPHPHQAPRQGPPPLIGFLDELVRGFVANPELFKGSFDGKCPGQSKTTGAAGAEEKAKEGAVPPFDFTAAAAQVEEFLKAVGIPVDLSNCAGSANSTNPQPGTSKMSDGNSGPASQQADQKQNEGEAAATGGSDPGLAMILNQLLSMGFQNQAQLTQLIQSMNGDLNSVLTALVP